jgi:hypothetical protein
LPAVHGPPFAYPQVLLAASHTPLRQRFMELGEHPPGTGWPFTTFGVQVPLLHQVAIGQSPSTPHVRPQAPVVELQIVPVCPMQSVAMVHLPQLPTPVQYGFVLPHAYVAPDPLSPVHPVHVSLVPDVLQNGVLPVHAAVLVPEHTPHVPFA